MASTTTAAHFDFFVVGGGSGGMAAARRAAQYGAKVGIAEGKFWGGTCVNVGCVPKKIMWMGANVREALAHEIEHYGMKLPGGFEFSWRHLKERRDASVKRLNGIYTANLDKSNCTHFDAMAKFSGPPADEGPVCLSVGGTSVTANRVLLAPGGKPMKLGIPGEELCIDSDGFFELESLPKRIAVLGAGYIAVELAGVLNGLGAETHHFVRFDSPLRPFDSMLKEALVKESTRQGVHLHTFSIPSSVCRKEGKLSLQLENGQTHDNFDVVLAAPGRVPLTETLGLELLSPEQRNGFLTSKGHIVADEFQNTKVSRVYALGDVCGKVELTPMAIAAGRRLADRLFGGMPYAKAEYEPVPTVVFSHPPIGTIGLSEEAAVKLHGRDELNVYRSTSVNLYYNVFDVPPAEKPRIEMKLVCTKPDDRIIGLHVVGMGADEMLQGFAVAVKMGATKADFDRCLAIHPTAAEEFVTIAPWGLPKPEE